MAKAVQPGYLKVKTKKKGITSKVMPFVNIIS